MDLELRLRTTERRKRRDGDELSLPQIEHWALIDLAVRELDDVSTEVGSDAFEALDDAFPALGVNLHEPLPTALETLALLCLYCHGEFSLHSVLGLEKRVNETIRSVSHARLAACPRSPRRRTRGDATRRHAPPSSARRASCSTVAASGS